MPGHVLIGLAPTPQTAGKKPPKPDTGRTRKYRLQNLTPDDTGRHNQEKGSKHRLLVGPAKLELGDTRQHQPNPAGKTARKADTKRHQTTQRTTHGCGLGRSAEWLSGPSVGAKDCVGSTCATTDWVSFKSPRWRVGLTCRWAAMWIVSPRCQRGDWNRLVIDVLKRGSCKGVT